MSRLTRNETAEPGLARDRILRRERRQGNVCFLCSADNEQDWQPYPADLYSATCPPVLLTCPLHTNSGCGKERHILIGPW